MNFEAIFSFLDQITQRDNLAIGFGLLVLLGIFVLLIRRQPRQIVAYKTEHGKVLIARSAIRELVQSACEQLDGVSKPKTCIRIKGGRVHFDVSVKLVGTNQLRQVESTLQQHMRRALTENLGIEKLGNINVIATGFKSGRVEQAAIKSPRKSSPEAPHEADSLSLAETEPGLNTDDSPGEATPNDDTTSGATGGKQRFF